MSHECLSQMKDLFFNENQGKESKLILYSFQFDIRIGAFVETFWENNDEKR